MDKLLVYNPKRNGYKPEEVDGCVFCSKKILDTFKIFESKYWVVRANAFPFVDGAVLIIPKRHVEYNYEINVNEWIDLKTIMDTLSKRWRDHYGKKDFSFNFYVNNGPNSGQSQKHLHWHFIPRIHRVDTAMELVENFHKVKLTPEDTVQIFK